MTRYWIVRPFSVPGRRYVGFCWISIVTHKHCRSLMNEVLLCWLQDCGAYSANGFLRVQSENQCSPLWTPPIGVCSSQTITWLCEYKSQLGCSLQLSLNNRQTLYCLCRSLASIDKNNPVSQPDHKLPLVQSINNPAICLLLRIRYASITPPRRIVTAHLSLLVPVYRNLHVIRSWPGRHPGRGGANPIDNPNHRR